MSNTLSPEPNESRIERIQWVELQLSSSESDSQAITLATSEGWSRLQDVMGAKSDRPYAFQFAIKSYSKTSLIQSHTMISY